MHREGRVRIHLFLLLSLLSGAVAAADGVNAKVLVQDSKSWDGGAYSYQDGGAQITIQKIEVDPRGGPPLSLDYHCHPVPLAAYVEKGGVEVVKADGVRHRFTAGEAFIEIMNTWHKGVFSEPTSLIVFYAGARELPLSRKRGEQPDQSRACKD